MVTVKETLKGLVADIADGLVKAPARKKKVAFVNHLLDKYPDTGTLIEPETEFINTLK